MSLGCVFERLSWWKVQGVKMGGRLPQRDSVGDPEQGGPTTRGDGAKRRRGGSLGAASGWFRRWPLC